MGNRCEPPRPFSVEQMTILLDPPPDWRPDSEAALARLLVRMNVYRGPVLRRWMLWAFAAAGLCAAAFLVPSTRVLAQQLWQFLRVGRVQVVRFDLSNLPAEGSSLRARLLGQPAPPSPARDPAEAAQRAGFVPRLPRPGVLSGAPRLSTMGAMSFGTVLRLSDIETLLRKAGVTDQPIPAEWDGARLSVHSSPIVMADWPEITLMQALPLTVTMPAGFDLDVLFTAVLRGLGLARRDAQRLAARMMTSPSIILPIDPEDDVTIREVALRSGTATLIESREDGTVQRITLTWSVSDRLYVLSGGVREEVLIAAANAID
jgi:hypothetical protein